MRGARGLARLAFPLLGFLALVWFLARCLPKPRRAAYPCQRVAAPLGLGFLAWLGGVFGAAAAVRRLRSCLGERRFVAAACAALIALAAGVAALSALPRQTARADGLGANQPIGEGKGVHPGRVVWIHEPEATDWDGPTSAEHWYESDHTDGAVVASMLSQAVRRLTGEATDAAAWSALFRYLNAQRGRGAVGYQAGETIAIKVNLTTAYGSDSPQTIDPATYEKKDALNGWTNWRNRIDTSPQLTAAVLRQLVNVVGVPQASITVGDPTDFMAGFFYTPLHTEFPNVVYMDYRGQMGRTAAQLSSTVRLRWSHPAAATNVQDYITARYADADYFINLAVLKTHDRAGVTLCAKNHYGSLLRKPTGELRGVGKLNYFDLHKRLPVEDPGTGRYRALVDLMGHRQLGGKTVLYVIDALYAGSNWEGYPRKWQMAPFSNDWPSSLLVSQDPVAIDSVGYDFLVTEWPAEVLAAKFAGGASDYLVEAALAAAPPSGTVYDPEQDGTNLASLGVHEHWNSAADRQYSRNLGTGPGIELLCWDAEGEPRMRSKLYLDAAPTGAIVRCTSLAPDATYRLEFSTNLLAAWSNLYTFTAAQAATNWWEPATAAEGARFYRLRQEP